MCPARSVARPVVKSQSLTSRSPDAVARTVSLRYARAGTAPACPVKDFTSLPVAESYSRATLSAPTVAKVVPSGLTATFHRESVASAALRLSSSAVNGQRCSVPSTVPAAASVPSGEMATALTPTSRVSPALGRAALVKVARVLPVAVSQTRAVRSAPPVTNRVPSGVAARAPTRPACPA